LTSLVVVVPLKAGAADQARELLAAGPPFDLEQSAFSRHAVHMTEREVIFVFEGEGDSATLALGAEEPELWEAASAWKEIFAERPRIARPAFSWVRVDPAEEVFFEPTPGPGDSDGGDLYTPGEGG
jgi:hypothetical protein